MGELYSRPYEVIQRKKKAFLPDIKGNDDWVFIDQLKPAYLQDDDTPPVYDSPGRAVPCYVHRTFSLRGQCCGGLCHKPSLEARDGKQSTRSKMADREYSRDSERQPC